jgi:hypothetical protein
VEILATRDDSELCWDAVEGNGDILGLTLGGNMGACDVTVNAFMPDGSPVPFFQRQFAASLEHAGRQSSSPSSSSVGAAFSSSAPANRSP